MIPWHEEMILLHYGTFCPLRNCNMHLKKHLAVVESWKSDKLFPNKEPTMDIKVRCDLKRDRKRWHIALVFQCVQDWSRLNYSWHLFFSYLVLELTGLRLGMIGLFCLVFLFLPVARGSVLLRLVDIPFELATRYHIWLGHLTMLLFTLHGLLYIIAWALQGELLSEVSFHDTFCFRLSVLIHACMHTLHKYLYLSFTTCIFCFSVCWTTQTFVHSEGLAVPLSGN